MFWEFRQSYWPIESCAFRRIDGYWINIFGCYCWCELFARTLVSVIKHWKRMFENCPPKRMTDLRFGMAKCQSDVLNVLASSVFSIFYFQLKMNHRVNNFRPLQMVQFILIETNEHSVMNALWFLWFWLGRFHSQPCTYVCVSFFKEPKKN